MGIINRVIKNPICIGIIQKGESQSSVLPELKIIDEEVFARAQEIVRERVVPQSEVPLTTRGSPFWWGMSTVGIVAHGSHWLPPDGTIRRRTER